MNLEDGEFELTDTRREAMKNQFLLYDKEANGKVPLAKIGDVLTMLGALCKPEEVKELQRQLEPYQDSETGQVGFDEFIPFGFQIIKAKKEASYYKELFRILDKNKNGFIPADALRAILKHLSDQVGLSEQDVDDMIDDIDEDGNGEVDFDEFLTLMTAS